MRGRVYCESNVWTNPPKNAVQALPETVQLTVEEVRLEQARLLSILLNTPTRVRGARIEVLLGGAWAEQRF